MKQPITIILLCVALLLIACESKKDKAFRLLTNDSEAYWELKSVYCKKGKASRGHNLVISFSTDSICDHYYWDGDFYSTHDYYERMHPIAMGCEVYSDYDNKWKLLNENLLLIEEKYARIISLTEDTMKLDYFSENCNERVFVRMKDSNLVRR